MELRNRTTTASVQGLEPHPVEQGQRDHQHRRGEDRQKVPEGQHPAQDDDEPQRRADDWNGDIVEFAQEEGL